MISEPLGHIHIVRTRAGFVSPPTQSQKNGHNAGLTRCPGKQRKLRNLYTKDKHTTDGKQASNSSSQKYNKYSVVPNASTEGPKITKPLLGKPLRYSSPT